MFIDVSMSSGFSSSDVLLSGEDRDHTGIESGGGGGIEGDANAVAATAEGNERCDDAAASQSTAVQNELTTASSSGTQHICSRRDAIGSIRRGAGRYGV
mmetsp:Transcript_32108/g.71090  ORF Transcript_32108/g.71090 Transcript_32108/m.71090 type:complete len:99 (-) Transcript_32108:30-326(-)